MGEDRGQIGLQTLGVAIDDIRCSGVGAASRDEDREAHHDRHAYEKSNHGSNFALDDLPPKVAVLTLFVKIQPGTL
ncbi:hypothetical protein ACQP1G_32800 [Nocardia sp. CA-107356]|uniref:hypothetical protein n=1 Tax=Nocardia sp. CA-107356 TaxID=3239972 RepID=UPI003D89F85C